MTSDDDLEGTQQTSKLIDGVEYMEMINWDEYRETYFARVRRKDKELLFDLITTQYASISVKDLPKELRRLQI